MLFTSLIVNITYKHKPTDVVQLPSLMEPQVSRFIQIGKKSSLPPAKLRILSS